MMTDAPETIARSPWHEGELAIQRKAGVDKRMTEVGRRVMRDFLPEQHRAFYPLLPYVMLGAVDPAGDVWATVRAGQPGFLYSPDALTLHVGTARDAMDPADSGMEDSNAVALLGIDLMTRRRNRLNGTVHRENAGGFDLHVGMSYGNCPQYITLRDYEFVRDAAAPASAAPQYTDHLDERARELIRFADAFFVASYVDRDEDGVTQRQVDVSHRGGKPGFVRIGEDGVLTIPDFAGNLFFNTLGNILVNSKAGLVFPDFETGDLLQLTGEAEVALDSPEIAAFQGAERLWRFTTRRAVYRSGALPLRWTKRRDSVSPSALLTGDWHEAASRLKAATLAHAWRPMKITHIVDESATIRSFHLEPMDDAGLVAHAAGQHLPIRVTLPGETRPVIRTYTLSVAPSDGLHRISVKREGRVSSYLHDALAVGDVIETRSPAGSFTIDAAERRPAVLLAAGVGITPMLAMLRHIVYEGFRKHRIRTTYLFYAAHSKAERAFDREIAALEEAAGGAVRVIRILGQTDGALESQDYDEAGRIDMAMLSRRLPFNDYDFYLCGPVPFMQSIYDGLRGLNIGNARIHAEAFGPASLIRKLDADAGAGTARPAAQPAQSAVPVVFTKSGKEARWTPESGTLLELAEARGLAPEFSCRGGSCGTCRTKILQGAVAYPVPPAAEVAADEALICCAMPAAAEPGAQEAATLQLDL
ncbi:2Fe-2S iron-sulfur cluster-binding protein [Paraburkholderia saeva]|uniref:Flavohemoprotein n=1 Tax=Paraburkholderia saeva TaxID=2777537 RepID=A0A9N8RXB5_9BURK|nr:pyridoxamine 5'-phosphate oxidase family protein [Paraburkholderia saeva]CAG4901376.1 Flavohemoprotein [Paraburkholderia saeva]